MVMRFRFRIIPLRLLHPPHTLFVTLCVSTLLLIAGPTSAGDSARLGLHRIDTYEVVNNKLIIIKARGKKTYRADLFPGCFGLRHAHTLGFQTSGGNSLDKFSSVVLPDGSRCRIKEFILLPQLPETPLQGDIQVPDATGN